MPSLDDVVPDGDGGGLFSDDDDRQSLSSEDTGSAYVPSDNGSLHPGTLYRTPDGRSQASSVGQPAKKKLTRVSGGRICIVTNESAPEVSIEAAHLVPRSTPKDMLTKLEFAFGLRYKQMHIDTTRNLVYIKVDLHRSFDHKGWFLLPEREILSRIKTFMANPTGQTYKQLFTRPKFTYRIIPLQMYRENFGVFRRVYPERPEQSDITQGSSAPVYEQIFPMDLESPPLVESHVNPFFVIANAGPKIDADEELLPPGWGLHDDIGTLLLIWRQMRLAKPTNEWLSKPRYGGNGGHGAEDRQGSQPGDGQSRGSPPSRPRRCHRNAHFSSSGAADAGPSLSGRTFARTAADLPELDKDDQSDATESDVLTHDAIGAVAVVDRSEFFQKWLHGVGCSTAGPDFGVTSLNSTEL